MTSANTVKSVGAGRSWGDDKQEMMRAAGRILSTGGSTEDVAAYFHNAYDVTLPGYTPPVSTPGMTQGLAMNALQGLTFGFGDEALGSIFGLLMGQGAQGGRDEYRAELQKFNEQHPVAGMLAEVGGGALLGGTGAAKTLGAKAATMGTMGKIGLGTAVGGGAGMAMGAGNTQGGLSERAGGLVRGGVAGVIAGALASTGVAAAGVVLKPAGRQVVNWGEKLVGRKNQTASFAARNVWAEAIVRDQGSIDAAIDFVRKQPAGAPIAMADLGENSGQLVQAASGMRGPGKQKLVEELLTRQADQGDRLLSKLFRATKLGAENAYDAADELIANRKAFSEPLYTEAYKQITGVTPEIQKILNHPKFQKAYEYGRLIAQDEDLAGVANQGALKIPPLTIGKQGVEDTFIPVRGLDYLKRGLDVLIRQSDQPGSEVLDKQSARAFRKLLNDALDSVEDVPDFARARKVWKGESEALEALQTGKGGKRLNEGTDVTSVRFVNKPPEVIKRELASMEPAQQELYKLGAMQDISEFLAESTAQAPDLARKMGGRLYGETMTNIEKRVRAMLGDNDVAEEVMDYVKAEARISKAVGRLGGSRTAPMAQAMGELAGTVSTRGGVGRMAADAVFVPLRNRARAGWSDAISDEVSSLAIKGVRGRDELLAVLYSLKSIAPTGRAGTAISTTAGQQGAQLR